jgi:YD repeat-containing protein
MIGTFPGKLALVEGDEVDVDLEIAGGRLRLTTGVSEIGAWPLDACLVTALPTGAYELTLDGERVAFSPDHPDAFSAVVARMAPVEPPPPSTGYDLEAALDQVLGGDASYEVPGLVEESAAEIAVTLEALFATAYPDYEIDEDVDEPLDAHPESDLGVASEPIVEPPSVPTPPPSIIEVVEEVVESDPAPLPDPIPSPPAVAGDAGFDLWSATPAGEEEIDESVEPLVDVSSWVGEVQDVPVWTPPPVAEDDGTEPEPLEEAEPVGEVDPLDRVDPIRIESPFPERSELGARWRPGSVEAGEDPEDGEVFDVAEGDDDAAGTGFDTSDSDVYRADEPDDVGLPEAWRIDELVDVADDADDDVAADDLSDAVDDLAADGDTPDGGYRPPTGRNGGFGTGGPPGGWQERPAPRSPDFGGDSAYPERGLRRGSEFDLEGAAASAGYSMPGDQVEMEEVVERIPARRGMGGIFSKSAGERFSAVSGALRDQPELDEDDDLGSVADQILASQEQLRSGSKVVRFTPALVKKVTIGLVILTIVGGFVLITPTVIGFLVDRVQSEVEVASPATTVPSGGSTVAPTPSTTVPENETTTGGIAVVDSRPVFELDAAGFVDRWNDTGSRVAESLVIDDVPAVGAFGLGFTRFLGMEGVVDDGGLMDSYTVVVDPLGDPQDDQLGIQAFGVAINVAEPEATGPELSSILLDMGLDVANPVVEGLGGSTARNGVIYALEYDEERQLIRLTVSAGSSSSQPEDPTP